VSGRKSAALSAHDSATPEVARKEKDKGGATTANAVARTPIQTAPADKTAPAEVNGQAMGDEEAPTTHEAHKEAAVRSVGPAKNRDKGHTTSPAHTQPSDEGVADDRDDANASFADEDADDPEPVSGRGPAANRSRGKP